MPANFLLDDTSSDSTTGSLVSSIFDSVSRIGSAVILSQNKPNPYVYSPPPGSVYAVPGSNTPFAVSPAGTSGFTMLAFAAVLFAVLFWIIKK